MNCELGEHIRDEGWEDYNKPESHETIVYAEYNNTGAGAEGLYHNLRAAFAKQLTDKEALHYTKELVLRGHDGWYPQ